MRFSRADRSLLAEWWFTADRTLLTVLLGLLGLGVVLALAASPAVAVRKGFHAFHFVERQVVFALAGAIVMAGLSLLTPRGVRRLALIMLAGTLLAMVAVLVVGPEVNGARRWLRFHGQSMQPSELMKPAFVVITAWLLSEAASRRDMPALPTAVVLLALAVALLVPQPDIGQAALVTLLWGALLVLSGVALAWACGLLLVGGAGLVAAYQLLPHVKARIDRFLNPATGDTYQTDRALQSFIEGGFFGRGPGEGTIKNTLPDAHTDFIFAVVAEEYGVLACLGIVLAFAFLAFRALIAVRATRDTFTRLAVIGLVLLISLQALINMSVSVGLLPAKGMTLPFLSAGGSSTVAMAVAAGFLLALTRRRPELGTLSHREAERAKKPDSVASEVAIRAGRGFST